MKKKKHNKVVKDYDKQKEKHLEKLATKMLANDEKCLESTKAYNVMKSGVLVGLMKQNIKRLFMINNTT